jgi:Holliday junction resolvasome RuvABC endonuclease subunit
MSQETDDKILKLLERIDKVLTAQYPTIFCEHEFSNENSTSTALICNKCGELKIIK